jgi:hypothetical protein
VANQGLWRNMGGELVVMDSSTFRDIDYSMCEGLKQESNSYIVGRLHWDQERLGPEDLLSLHGQ